MWFYNQFILELRLRDLLLPIFFFFLAEEVPSKIISQSTVFLIIFLLWLVLRVRILLPMSFMLMTFFFLQLGNVRKCWPIVWSSYMFMVLSRASGWTLLKVSLSLLMSLFLLIIIFAIFLDVIEALFLLIIWVFLSFLMLLICDFFQPLGDRVKIKLSSSKGKCLSMIGRV